MVLAKLIFGFGGGGGGSKGKSHAKKHKKTHKCSVRSNFDEWKLYDDFWEEEGEAAFKNYVEKRKTDEKAPETEA